MAQTPYKPEDVTAEWLAEKVGTTVNDFSMEQIGIGVGLLGRLYRITLDGGDPKSVIAKFPTLDEGARMNVVEHLRFYEKEVSFYRQARDAIPVDIPKVYAAEFDRESGDFVLLFQDCGDCRMADQIEGCSVEDTETAIDAMTKLHALWWGSDFADVPWVSRYNEPPYPQVLAGMYKQSWPRATEIFGDHLAPAYREFGDRFEGLIQWFMDSLTSKPLTFCHGDFRLDNLFFRTEDHQPAVTIVDWQICFQGRGAYDLAYFISQSLQTEDRRKHEQSLIDRYANALSVGGIDYPRDELMDDYRRTVAYCFIYPVVAAGQFEVANERQRQLLLGMLDRCVAAIEDHDALAVLPS